MENLRGEGIPETAVDGTCRQAARQQKIAEISFLLDSTHSVGEVLQTVTEGAREIVGAHQAVTSIVVDGNWARSINAVSLSDKYAAWRSYYEQPDGSGIYRLVCEMNRPLRMSQEELEAHPAWRGFGKAAGKHPPMRGWLAAPLTGRRARNIGLMQLSDMYDGDFTEEDESVLVQLAQLASVAIQNARSESRKTRRVSE